MNSRLQTIVALDAGFDDGGVPADVARIYAATAP